MFFTMKKGLKKLLAGVALGAMVMGASVPAFAITDTTNKYNVQFYAESDGQYVVAPWGMDDGNIASATVSADGTSVDMKFKLGEFNIMGFIPTSGYITSITDAAGKEMTTDLDKDGNADIATLATGPNNIYVLKVAVASGNLGHVTKNMYVNLTPLAE